MGYRDNFELKEGTGFQAILMAAPALYAGAMAANAKMQYGKEVAKIEGLLENRQNITNPYKDLENPYKNLPVATQAARFQAENADIALANTLDTLRATGAAAGGATALAQAALQSQQGISASLEKQEAENARLRAQGQLQVDAAKAKGETFRMRMQEARDVRDINRIQRQADIFKATQVANERAMFDQIGSALETLSGGVVPKQIQQQPEIEKPQSDLNTDPGVTSGTPPANVIDPTTKSLQTPAGQTGAQVVGLDPNTSAAAAISANQNQINSMINATMALPDPGVPYYGPPSLNAADYQRPAVDTNFMPTFMRTFTPSSNLFNDPFASLTGYDLSKTYIDPVTRLRLTK